MQAITKEFTSPVFNKVILYIGKRKYEFLLFSFMLLIFSNTFTQDMRHTGYTNVLQNMMVGAVVFYHRKYLRILILFLLSVSLILNVFGTHLPFINVRSWRGIIYLVFFLLISIEVFKEVLYIKIVSRELLAAALCGFVVLCLVATFLFFQIEMKQSHSFSNIGEGIQAMDNLNYFSFTTLLTTGFGDITPVSLVAKRAVMLMGLTGHFYTVFITSIIIGKYLSAKKSEAAV